MRTVASAGRLRGSMKNTGEHSDTRAGTGTSSVTHSRAPPSRPRSSAGAAVAGGQRTTPKLAYEEAVAAVLTTGARATGASRSSLSNTSVSTPAAATTRERPTALVAAPTPYGHIPYGHPWHAPLPSTSSSAGGDSGGDVMTSGVEGPGPAAVASLSPPPGFTRRFTPGLTPGPSAPPQPQTAAAFLTRVQEGAAPPATRAPMTRLALRLAPEGNAPKRVAPVAPVSAKAVIGPAIGQHRGRASHGASTGSIGTRRGGAAARPASSTVYRAPHPRFAVQVARRQAAMEASGFGVHGHGIMPLVSPASVELVCWMSKNGPRVSLAELMDASSPATRLSPAMPVAALRGFADRF